MSKKYVIWDKKSNVYTPSGEKFTAEQWIERWPVAELESIKVVCAGGDINGAFFGVLRDMIDIYSKAGCDFSTCETDQDYLDAIEVFEDEMNAPSTEPTVEERTAAALEFIAMSSLPDDTTGTETATDETVTDKTTTTEEA